MMAMFVNGSKRNEQFPQRTFHRRFLPRFSPFGQAVSEQKILKNRPIRNKNCLWWPCLLMDQNKMTNLIENLPQMLPTNFRFIWQSGFRGEDFFRNQPIRNKNCLWWPCLLMDREEMSNCNRGLSIGSTGTILEKDAYFPSLMDRHTSRLIFFKMIRYLIKDSLSGN